MLRAGMLNRGGPSPDWGGDGGGVFSRSFSDRGWMRGLGFEAGGNRGGRRGVVRGRGGGRLTPNFATVPPSSSQASATRRRPDRTPSRISSRSNSFLLIDTTGIAHLRGPSNPGQCHVNFAEGCHLYIAATGSAQADADSDGTTSRA